MNWHFLTDSMLEETQSGYAISLLDGTWKEPISIEPKAPANMGAHEQAKYMKAGFAFINSKDKKKKRSLIDLLVHRREKLNTFALNSYS